jgi:hypothetical protein
MIVHLIDGTYELFRHYCFLDVASGPVRRRRWCAGYCAEDDRGGSIHLGVATDHVIESFRNEIWSGYKTGNGIDPALLAQFGPLEESLEAMGVTVWPMVDLEADDALASAASLASKDCRVEKVCIWTPDKDLAQWIQNDRIVQVIEGAKRFETLRAYTSSSESAPHRFQTFLRWWGIAQTDI